MKRAAFVVLLLGMGLVLSAFSLFGVQAQTTRVRWDTFWRGVAYSDPVPRSTAFNAPFVVNGYSSVGGPAIFRADGITCAWAVVGTTDGGTNDIIVDIVHQDAGVDCSCDIGSCDLSHEVSRSCTCSTPFEMQNGSTYYVLLDSTTACILVPAQMHCAVDLFR